MKTFTKTSIISAISMAAFPEQTIPEWTTKSNCYLGLDRQDKHDRIWSKITENDQSGGWHMDKFESVERSSIFDEVGDEFDCRSKVFEGVGTVAKASWRSVGDHSYTGIFRGGDSGFVRLATSIPVDIEQEIMSPAMGIKFMRDGVDSANILALVSFDFQQSLNFFENSMTNNIAASVRPPLVEGFGLFAGETDFPWSMGLAKFASVTQDGVEEDPVFPWKLRFEPATSYVTPIEDPSEFDFTEKMTEIPSGETIYEIYAWDMPEEMGGSETHIGDLVLESQLVTSLWGDEHMFFRHHRMDEDLKYHPEWQQYTPPLVAGMETQIREPSEYKSPSSCPFAFLWQQQQETEEPLFEESDLAIDLFAMLDTNNNGDIHMNAAERKCDDLVPEKMDEQTSDTYLEILRGTEDRYGCLFMNNQARCVVSFDNVAKYIEDEGYEQDEEDGYWYALTPTQPTRSDLANSLFRMLDGNSSDDINSRIANRKCTNFVPNKMKQETSDTYREIINGVEQDYGCSQYNERGDCIIPYYDALHYIYRENYTKLSDKNYWYKQEQC